MVMGASLVAQLVEPACNTGDSGSIPGLGRSPGEEMAAYSNILAWENPMDRGAWQATVPGVENCWT